MFGPGFAPLFCACAFLPRRSEGAKPASVSSLLGARSPPTEDKRRTRRPIKSLGRPAWARYVSCSSSCVPLLVHSSRNAWHPYATTAADSTRQPTQPAAASSRVEGRWRQCPTKPGWRARPSAVHVRGAACTRHIASAVRSCTHPSRAATCMMLCSVLVPACSCGGLGCPRRIRARRQQAVDHSQQASTPMHARCDAVMAHGRHCQAQFSECSTVQGPDT
jgi:hypothetical protein